MNRHITKAVEPPEICRDCQFLRRSFEGAPSLSAWTCRGGYSPGKCALLEEGERELRNDIDEAEMIDHADPERAAEQAEHLHDCMEDR